MVENYALEVKIEMLKAGVKKQDVAKKLNIFPQNFSRLLRQGVSKEKKEQIEKAIKEITNEK